MEEIMVVENIGAFDEDIFYCGNSELEAYMKYKRLKIQNKRVNMIKAKVVRKLFKNVPFIWNYEVVEVIK